MQSFVPFVLGFYLNFLIFFKVLYEFGSMENQCSLDRAAHFRPRLPFGVCLELYDQVYELVNIEADMPLLLQPLDVGGVAGRQDE